MTRKVDCEIERYAVDADGLESEKAHTTLLLSEEIVVKIGRVGGVLDVSGPLLDMLDAGRITADEAALIALGEQPMPGHA